MGLWLYPMPEMRITGVVSVPKHDDLIPMVDTLSYLMNSNIVQGTTRVAGSLTSQARDPELIALRSRPGGATIAELEEYLRRKNLPYWSIELPFYGPAEVVPAQWAFAKRKFSAITGVQFRDGASNRLPPSPEDLAKVANPVPLGVPSLAIFSALGPNSQGHIDVSPITPMTGQAVFEVMEVFDKVLQEMGINNVGVVPAGTYYPRSFFFLFTFPIEHDVEKNRKMRAAFKRLVQVGAEHGWGEYRTHLAFMDDVANAYSFNNHALLRLHETLKDALDPNGILAPGKSGIWPKHMRKARA
jgi:4-cresol dehydrogenase (hydroxylating)